MGDAFTGEIRMLPYLYAPADWAYCDGQLYPLQQNPALYSVIGITFGGNGNTNFGLPNLKGRAPLHPGTGPGLSPHQAGQASGVESAILYEQNLPQHTHAATVCKTQATTPVPTNQFLAVELSPEIMDWATVTDPAKLIAMDDSALSQTGGSQSHENCQPFLVVPFCICINGIYPMRS